MDPSNKSVTQLLLEVREGDESAIQELWALVESDLRRLARRFMGQQHPGHTLQPTVLVDDAYLRLVNAKEATWENRACFFAFAAKVMRNILVDYARAQQTDKRPPKALKASLDEAALMAAQQATDILEVHSALEKLKQVDPRQADIVELKFFGGLTIEETAEVLGIGTSTVEIQWRKAKKWLYCEMSGSQE